MLTPYFLIPSHYAALKIKPFASAPDFTWHILPIFVIKKAGNHSRISKKRPKHMKFNRLNTKTFPYVFFLIIKLLYLRKFLSYDYTRNSPKT